MKRKLQLVIALIGLLCLSARGLATDGTIEAQESPNIVRVSVNDQGIEGNSYSSGGAVSEDGLHVAFASQANNLVPGDTNGYSDIFVRNLDLNTTERVSLTTTGQQNPSLSNFTGMSDDARYVAFDTNGRLSPVDTNNYFDAYIRDQQLGITNLVSVGPNGQQANDHVNGRALSPDGRYVLLITEASNWAAGDAVLTSDVFVRDLFLETTTLASVKSTGGPGNNDSSTGDISDDGRFAVFASTSSNLTPDDTDITSDIFLRDRVAETTTLISVSLAGDSAGGEAPSISSDGRFIAFTSSSANIVPNDTNSMGDIFVYDLQTDSFERVSVTSTGGQANHASNNAVVSGDGRYVSFSSRASNLVSGIANTDTFRAYIHDRETGATEAIAVTAAGAADNASSSNFSVSPGGHYLVFSSGSGNLVPDDTNGQQDVFLRIRTASSHYSISGTVQLANGELMAGSENHSPLAEDESSQVLDQNASSIVGAIVCADGNRCDTSGPGGHFEIDGLEAGTYSLSASKVGHTFTPSSTTVTIPPSATGVNFTGQLLPIITGISPASGPVGAVVSIAGYGLSGTTSVTFNGGAAAAFTVVSVMQINTTVPNEATTGPIVVTTPVGVASSTLHFTVTTCPAELAQRPLVLIPGWGGADTLASDSSGFEKLIEPLENASYREGCNLFYVGATSAELSLHENGIEVQRVLCNAYSTVQHALQGSEWHGEFDLIGHSYGGLHAREYLETELYNNGQDNCPGKPYSVTVGNLFTLGTPHAGGGTLPGAIKIALPYYINEETRDSANALWSSNMREYNESHHQPKVCYRLIGGDVSDSERELPPEVRAVYFLLGQRSILSHHDLGVYVSSSLQLGRDEWNERYPNVLTYETVDIHGYFDEMGLGSYRSYVSPSPWETFNLLRPFIGASLDHCGNGGGGGASSPPPLTEAADEPENLTFAVIATGIIHSGTSQEGVFEVVDGGQSAVLLEWPLGTLELTLTDPNGAVLDASISDSNPSVQHVAAITLGQFEGFTFTEMPVGDWSYTITWVGGNPAQPIPYVLYRLPEQPISVAVTTSPEIQANGAPVQVAAALRYDGTMAVTGAQVEAVITGPSGLTETIQLFDDGAHGDGGVGDGDYGATFVSTGEGGQYHIVVEARGVFQEEPFQRNGVAGLVIMSAVNTITGGVAERPVDLDDDGDYDLLATDVAIEIGDAGDYRLSADLVTQDGQLVASAGEQGSFDTGLQTVTLVFAGRDISASLQGGPYILTNVVLLNANNNSLQDEWTVGYTTGPYQYWEFDLPPIVSGFTPTSGPVGSLVTITGIGFIDTTAVLFGDEAVENFTVVLDTQIDAQIPMGAATGSITVFTPDGSTVSSEEFVVLPTITNFSPTYGPEGTIVAIIGTTLSDTTEVSFNGAVATSFTIISNTEIRATVPIGATTGKISITTPAGSAESTADFTIIASPTISGFNPNNGPIGTSVTITGAAFTGATAAAFNGTNATSFTVNSATQITAVVPAGATTGKIAVTTPVGTATSEADFTVIPKPTITGFSPTSGPVGTIVTITGTTLTGATTVTFNGTASTFTVVSATQISATVPAGATTGKIAVTTPGGTATSTVDFTVTLPPAPAIYLSPTGTGKLGVKSFTGADILSYVKTTNTWDVFYDGSYVKTAKNVGAFAFQGTDILLGFSAAQAITGLGTVAPQDLVRFTPTSVGYSNTAGAFAWFFDGSDVGLTTSAEAIDALWIDAGGRLYISTTGSGSVPVNSAQPTGAKVNFQDEDVLRFTPSSTGTTTAGAWALYWDPTTMTGMSAEDINGYWEDPATSFRYVTILGSFTIGSTTYGRQTGNGKTILRFAPNAAAPGGWAPVERVTWLAAGATFGSNIDGIEMAR